MDDPKFLKKHISTGAIDVHPSEKALIVNYELEATILGHGGDPMAGERKNCQKLIRLKDLSPSTDVGLLAREVVAKCRLIPESKLPEVQQLLYYLQKRKPGPSSGGSGQSDLSRELERSADAGGERASIARLDEYIELLYEDIPERVRGTALVLQLAKNRDNMEELLNNGSVLSISYKTLKEHDSETLLGALARILREDWKQFKNNFELPTNIAYIFFCFSTFSQFHAMISHFKVGALCMSLAEYEVKRYGLWAEDLRGKNMGAGSADIERNTRKWQILVSKQELLLRVSLALLRNLAESAGVEAKMVKRGLVPLLVDVVARDPPPCPPLRLLLLQFLAQLARFRESKDRMEGVVAAACAVVGSQSADSALCAAALRLLFNLSFDTQLRARMLQAGLVTSAVRHLGNEELADDVLRLLYHLSLDDAAKSMFTYTDAIPLCMRSFLSRSAQEEASLGLLVNLALAQRNAQLIAGDDGAGFALIAERAFADASPVCLKLLRNVAEHDGPTAALAQPLAAQLGGAVRSAKPASGGGDFALDALRLLGAAAAHPGIDWDGLLKEGKPSLLAWLRDRLKGRGGEEEWTLESVILLGAMASSGVEGSSSVLATNLIDELGNLLSAKQDDDEIVLQIVFVFYHILRHPGPRESLLQNTQVPAYLIDLMHDKNAEIRAMCDSTLEVIAESGEVWAVRIAEERFRWHNAQWLEMIAEAGGGFEDSEDEELADPDFLTDFAADEVLARPYSRLDHRRLSDPNAIPEQDESEEDVQLHPLTGMPIS